MVPDMVPPPGSTSGQPSRHAPGRGEDGVLLPSYPVAGRDTAGRGTGSRSERRDLRGSGRMEPGGPMTAERDRAAREAARACANCGKVLARRSFEDLANWRRRRHCDRRCAAEAYWKARKARRPHPSPVPSARG